MKFITRLKIKLFESIIGKVEITDKNKLEEDLGVEIHGIINQGSFANIYSTDADDKIVKITSDISDFRNLSIANRIIPNHVPKIHKSTTKGIGKNNVAMLIDYIEGKNFPLITNEMLKILQGDGFTADYEAARIRVLRPKGQIAKILECHNLMDKQDRIKIANLIKALSILDKSGIEMIDFDENIIDNGEKYVIIDLGDVEI